MTGPGAPDTASPSQRAAAAPADRCREWFEAHGSSVYGYLRFHLASADEAEDLTSEVFLRAVRAADRFDPARGSSKHWLLRLARNALRDHLRRERRRRSAPAAAMYDLRCDAPSPDERLLWEEQVARLLGAVSALGRDDRELIGLRYGSGLDTAEAAAILGVSQPVLRTRLWRALGRLRKSLET